MSRKMSFISRRRAPLLSAAGPVFSGRAGEGLKVPEESGESMPGTERPEGLQFLWKEPEGTVLKSDSACSQKIN